MTEDSPTLTFNTIGRHVSRMVNTKVVSNLSPWFSRVKPGDIHTIAVSHGEGRVIASVKQVEEMAKTGRLPHSMWILTGSPQPILSLIPMVRLWLSRG